MQSLSRAIKLIDGADLCFLSPQPDTSLHCETKDTIVHRIACQFRLRPSFCWYSLRLPSNHGGTARL